MNEQKDEAIEKNAELEKQNYLLKRSLGKIVFYTYFII